MEPICRSRGRKAAEYVRPTPEGIGVKYKDVAAPGVKPPPGINETKS
jgi:hypothetical protein